MDAMHNLLLGTAKNITRIWCEMGLLSSKELKQIQNIVSKINVPADIDQLPSNIASGYAGFTADQWRNWTCIFSPVALKDILPSEHLRCWLLFVKATSILCVPMISIQNVKLTDKYHVNPRCACPQRGLSNRTCNF